MVVYIAYPKLMESSYSKLMMNYMITTMMAYITVVLAQLNFGSSVSFSEKHPKTCEFNGMYLIYYFMPIARFIWNAEISASIAIDCYERLF